MNSDNNNSTIKQLVEFLTKHKNLYRIGKAEISDSEYNAIENKLRTIDPDNSILSEIESDLDLLAPASLKVKLPVPMLSTNKAYHQNEINQFFDNVEDTAKRINLAADKIVYKVTPKLDGVAGLNLNDCLMTRGDGLYGRDISHTLKHGVVNINPNQGPGEIVINQAYFDTYIKEQFNMTHPRNFIAGYLGALVLKEYHKKALKDKALVFEPFNQLNSWQGNKSNLIQNLSGLTKQLKELTPYMLDGIVVEVTNEQIKNEMGANNRAHRWMLAIKEEGETSETTIKDIVYQVGRTGRITPVIIIDPVYLSGATISKVTAHTAKTIVNKGLCVGTKIVVIRAGEVIPEISKVLTPCNNAVQIKHCPHCFSLLIEEGDEHIVCPNALNCLPQIVGSLHHFFSTLNNSKSLGEETLKKIVTNITGIKRDYLETIYNLDIHDLMGIGFGPIVTNNIINAIAESRNSAVEDWILLASFGIRHLGRGSAKKLLAHCNIYNVLDITVEQITSIPGFDVKTATSITHELNEKRHTIQYVLNLFVLPIGYKSTKDKPLLHQSNSALKPFNAKKFVVTGTFSMSRDDIQKRIKELGGELQNTVNSKTDYLLIGDNPGKSKLDVAKKFLSIKIVNDLTILNI